MMSSVLRISTTFSDTKGSDLGALRGSTSPPFAKPAVTSGSGLAKLPKLAKLADDDPLVTAISVIARTDRKRYETLIIVRSYSVQISVHTSREQAEKLKPNRRMHAPHDRPGKSFRSNGPRHQAHVARKVVGMRGAVVPRGDRSVQIRSLKAA